MMRLAFGTALLATAAFAGDFKATCPVSGAAAKEDHKVEKDGKTVYFCCDNCPTKYEKDAKKFATQVNYQLLQTNQIKQKACPFTGEKCDPETKTKVGKGAVEVCFCCEKCQGKVKAAKPADQVNMVFKDIKKGFEVVKKKDKEEKKDAN
jgi:YHS domain-containing protein